MVGQTSDKAPTVKKLKGHLFVCTNERPVDHPRGCCKARNSEAILAKLKSEIAKAGLTGSFRAQKAGCLDVCEFGPAVVIYPENVWYGPVTEDDAVEIVQSHLKNGKLVDRLRVPGK